MSNTQLLNCPTCKQKTQGLSTKENPHFPFCSHRCRLIDLGQWMEESYRIPKEVEQENDFDEDTV